MSPAIQQHVINKALNNELKVSRPKRDDATMMNSITVAGYKIFIAELFNEEILERNIQNNHRLLVQFLDRLNNKQIRLCQVQK